MKKLLLLTVAAIFSLSMLNAQTNFGVKAGVNFADVSGDMTESFTGRAAFHFGVMSEFMVSDKFGVQPELLFSSQGSKFEEEEDFIDITGTAKISYLNLPVMANIYVADGFFIQAGPQIGFLWCADVVDLEADGESFPDENIKDDLKGTDFGLNFGLGYKLDSGLNFGARYNLGLTNNLENEEFDPGAEYKNSVIQISVGWFF